MDECVDYWLTLADYDLGAAKDMLKAGRYIYVGFMCHMSVEKALKAVIASHCEEGDIPPKIHNLPRLAAIGEIFNDLSEDWQNFLLDLNPLNTEARYPEIKEQISALLSIEKCQKIISETEEFLCLIRKRF
jgi:HEPN domain-containing protein